MQFALTNYALCGIIISKLRVSRIIGGENMEQKLTYTAKEAAQAANVSMPTIYAWTRIEGFPVVRVGRKVVVPIDAFKRWLEEQAASNGTV